MISLIRQQEPINKKIMMLLREILITSDICSNLEIATANVDSLSLIEESALAVDMGFFYFVANFKLLQHIKATDCCVKLSVGYGMLRVASQAIGVNASRNAICMFKLCRDASVNGSARWYLHCGSRCCAFWKLFVIREKNDV